jgi:hypothetical protein
MSVTAVKFDRIGAGQKPKQTHPRDRKHQVASGISESGHFTKSLFGSPLKRGAYRPSAVPAQSLRAFMFSIMRGAAGWTSPKVEKLAGEKAA